MANVATTKLSSRGQVVIPEKIRKKLGLESGARFIVLAENDVVILKKISPPSIDEFFDLIEKAKNAAVEVGLKRSDITKAIRKVRSRQ